MRLTFSIFFILFLSTISFGQDLSDKSRYSLITLDGKEAYIDIQTGGIVYPNQVKQTAPVVKPIYSPTPSQPVVTRTNPSPIHKASYTVKKGDTLYSIARRYGMSANHLASTNGMVVNTPLTIGQRLVVEPASIPATYDRETTVTTVQPQVTGVYTVKKGDTLYSIARRYGITGRGLASMNNISINSTLNIGQKLKVAAQGGKAFNGTNSYVVQKGDTLYSIARKAGITVYELKRLNALPSNVIHIGQVLKVR